MFRVEVGDGVFFVDGALGAAMDFLLIGRTPITRGWDGDWVRLLLRRLFSGGFLRRHFGRLESCQSMAGSEGGFSDD